MMESRKCSKNHQLTSFRSRHRCETTWTRAKSWAFQHGKHASWHPCGSPRLWLPMAHLQLLVDRQPAKTWPSISRSERSRWPGPGLLLDGVRQGSKVDGNLFSAFINEAKLVTGIGFQQMRLSVSLRHVLLLSRRLPFIWNVFKLLKIGEHVDFECVKLVELVVVCGLNSFDCAVVSRKLKEGVPLGLALGVEGVVLVHNFAKLKNTKNRSM